MTTINRISGIASNPNLRKFYIDSRLTKGSLLLLDFSHEATGISNIPAHGSSIYNLASKPASKIVGGNESTLAINVGNSLTTASAKAEFTARKGLHVIKSQVNDVLGSSIRLNYPALLREYIFNNVTRGIFFSVWDSKTRLSLQGTTADLLILLANTGNYITALENTQWLTNASNLGKTSNPNQLGNRRATAAVNTKIGAPTIGADCMYKLGGGGAYGGFELNKDKSNIFYSMHCIDLMSAGMTYAEADALDLAYYNQYFGAGGIFANDTFTDPSTFL